MSGESTVVRFITQSPWTGTELWERVPKNMLYYEVEIDPSFEARIEMATTAYNTVQKELDTLYQKARGA